MAPRMGLRRGGLRGRGGPGRGAMGRGAMGRGGLGGRGQWAAMSSSEQGSALPISHCIAVQPQTPFICIDAQHRAHLQLPAPKCFARPCA